MQLWGRITQQTKYEADSNLSEQNFSKPTARSVRRNDWLPLGICMVVDMVREVGAPYDTYYLIAYTTVNLAIHATLSSALRERNRAQDTLGAQHRDQADTVLFCVAMLMVEVLRSQNTLFSLGLSDDLQSSEEAIARAWKDSIDARNTRS